MGKLSFLHRVKSVIASIGFRLFLWGNSMTKEEYWQQIYEQEKMYNKFALDFHKQELQRIGEVKDVTGDNNSI